MQRDPASYRFATLESGVYGLCPLPTYISGYYLPRRLLFSQSLCLAIIATWLKLSGNTQTTRNDFIREH